VLILANTLGFNGGTTFILRFCRENFRRGKKIGVLVMMDDPDHNLLAELKRYADVYFLTSFIRPAFRRGTMSPLIGFMPVDFKAISEIFRRFDDSVHVMGVFGLLFLARFVRSQKRSLSVSIGVYHQNEYMFSDVDYYFANYARSMFSDLGERGGIFFNEGNVESYSRFYRRDFSGSTLVPIGIDLPVVEKEIFGDPLSRKIVSIGNLVEFKSYNSHIINCLPGLLAIDPAFKYEIYGEGLYEEELRKLAELRGVLGAVEFKGRVAYSDFAKVLDGALLFVGSGTAIIEAAALGVPALIGIESTRDPVTYGFLCEIDGFSYNELEKDRHLTTMEAKITQIVTDIVRWKDVAARCKEKAKTFSIGRTVEGFDRHLVSSAEISPNSVAGYSNFLTLVSFLACAVKHKLGVDVEFANRRNQGTIG
jgi:1,2-diacylglycerol 3-alpha-glucosyltransferase